MAGPEEWGAVPVDESGPEKWGAKPIADAPPAPVATGENPWSSLGPQHAGAFARRLGGDIADVFMEGVHTTAGAPGKITNTGPTGFEDIGEQIKKSLVSAGFDEKGAQNEATRLTKKMQSNQGFMDLAMGPLTALTSPVIGAFRTLVSRPIEESTGFPHEATEQFSMIAAAAIGLRSSAARVSINPEGRVRTQVIGEIPPREGDFRIAAELLTPMEAPIGQFRRDAAVIRAAMPEEVAQGYTRLWRGNRVGEEGANPSFTNSLEGIALPFREGYGGKLTYVDVPTADLPKYESTGAAAPGAEFMLPADLAAQAKAAPLLKGPTATDLVEANLRRAWNEDGIHPAEAVNDAQRDAFLKHDLTAKPETIEAPADLVEIGATPKSLSAAANTDPPLVPLSEQPASSPGRLIGAAREGVDQLLGLGRNIQFMLDPMATGSNRAMVVAKDAMNSVRRIRWDHARIDADIVKNFTPEQRARMWNAADEESVALQLGESREHQGLITLEPAERAAVEDAHARAQSAWLHAVDTGIVEGEGLPAYTPRMVMNVASASSDMSPRALNELGRNVFTRTAQMNRRGYMTAEETEAAAKRLVGKRMAERGASMDEINAALEKIKIARDVRALPLATARLQEATVWRDMINKIEDIGKQTGSETVAVGYKPDNSWFTIAGNPAFTKWEPKFEKFQDVRGEPYWKPLLDEHGNTIFVPKPIYMHGEFRGPMTAILDESASKSKVAQGAQSAYGALMAIKGKSMTAILNSPLIHNEVVWSKVMEAAGGREWLGFGLYWRGNRIVSGNPARAGELIERGLNPMGPRGSFQDITGMMEQPNIDARYHESWTGKITGFVPGLFDERAGVAVESGIAKAGNFWHNTLLWDRVRDVQFGLADHLSDRLVSKGSDRLTADRIAAHFSNIIVGSIPKEAMSNAARATANMLLFSRSFTLGNLSTYKQAAMGLPKPILAQIERDFFNFKQNPETGVWEPPTLGADAAADVKKIAQGIARRKAVSTILLSAGLYYVGNALVQHAFNVTMRDSTVDEEMRGYARRYESLANDVSKDPFELRHMIGRLSPTYDNEPKKQDRAHVGYDKDGTAIYARNPTGKFGEELIGYPTMPMEMVRRKLSPMASGILDVLENDRGFGRKIYDENDKTIGGDVATAFAVAKHMVMKHLPEGQIAAGVDLLRGDGDPNVNRLRLAAPALGFTVSVGAPGGMARGEQLSAKQQFDARFNIQWPDIKKQIQRGDIDGARQAMDQIQVPPIMQRGLIRNANNPAAALHGRTLQNFYQYSTPEQRDRLERRQ